MDLRDRQETLDTDREDGTRPSPHPCIKQTRKDGPRKIFFGIIVWTVRPTKNNLA